MAVVSLYKSVVVYLVTFSPTYLMNLDCLLANSVLNRCIYILHLSNTRRLTFGSFSW